MDELQANVESLARIEGQTELQIITRLQEAAAITGNDDLLDALCELKWEYIN